MNTDGFYSVREIRDFRDLLWQSEELFSSRPAFKYYNKDGNIQEITFKELKENVQYLGTALCNLGLKDAKIAVIGNNSWKWCCSYFAVTCGTGVIVPIDKELMPDDIRNLISTADCKAVFCDEKAWKKLSQVIAELPEDIVYVIFEAEISEEKLLHFDDLLEEGKKLLNEGNSVFLDAEINPEGLGSLIFTSGTTGSAKGVMLSQKNICSDIMAVSKVVKVTDEDVILSVLPLHHTYECSLSFLMLLYCGGCLCFCQGLRYIQRDMQTFEPTLFVTVPLMLEKLHDRIIKKVSEKKMGKLALSIGKLAAGSEGFIASIADKAFAEIRKQFGGKLRLIIVGAAPLNPVVAKDFDMFGIPVYIGYGLTECAPLVIGNNDKLKMYDGVGVPLPGVEAKINKPDDNNVGEIFVKGPMVMMGYYENEEATAEVFDDEGWFHTGDMGSVDENGCFKVVGRFKNVIVTKNGKNIYPEELEYYLNSNPYVSESLVFGSDCDEAEEGTRVEAKIFPDIGNIMEKLKDKAQPTKDQISKMISEAVKEVNKKLPKYKRIKNFAIRDSEFIKTTTQKIKRQDNLSEDENSDNVYEAKK